MNWRQLACTSSVAVILSLLQTHGPACGPFPNETVYVYRTYPRYQSEAYAAGDMGVIFPTYWRRFLFVAYRYLNGQPLTAAEQAAFVGRRDGPIPHEPAGELWMKTREQVPGVEPLPQFFAYDTYRLVPDSQWQRFQNCHGDAFLTAAQTLQARIDEFGADSAGVRKWVTAQDAVFSNCREGAAIPDDPESDLPPLLAADRRYQIAAAHFYGADFREAQTRFATIAQDADSPWSDVAAYLVARCLIRRATLDPRPGFADLDLLSRADAELRRILDDPARDAIHPAARDLREFLAARLFPKLHLAEVANRLISPSDDRFVQDLIDFQFHMDRDAGHDAEVRRSSELIDWIVTFQSGEADHAVERWRATGGDHWLIAAISHAPYNHPAAADLRRAAASLDRDAPAWASATYYRLGQMLAGGEQEVARAELDELLSGLDNAEVRNLFLGYRLRLARDLDELLRFAPRTPLGRGYGMGDSMADALAADAPDLLFDEDSVSVFNQGLPVDLLSRAAASAALPAHLRRELTLIAWTRAVALEHWDVARALAGELRTFYPDLGPDLDRWLAAANEEERRFASAYLLLRWPGLKPHLVAGLAMRTKIDGIDSLRDNWWCAYTEPFAEAPPAFLGQEDRAALERERRKLLDLGAAPSRLGDIVIAFAHTHPDDPRVPEALHNVVRATRYGCTGEGNGNRSRAAFQMLHRYYPDSDWTARTPYWFN